MLSKNEVKYIQSLRLKKEREQAGLFVAEGGKITDELLLCKTYEVITVYGLAGYTNSRQTKHPGTTFRAVDEATLQKISQRQTPQQCLALVKMRPQVFEPFDPDSWSLMLDGIQDPGNLGSIIRIADWFGIRNIYATPETADLYNPKVVQATMGSICRVKMMYGPCLEALQKMGPTCYATHQQGDSIWEIGPLAPGVIMIGNEGKGLDDAFMALARKKISIPRLGGAESLNAAIATGIVVSHLMKPGS